MENYGETSKNCSECKAYSTRSGGHKQRDFKVEVQRENKGARNKRQIGFTEEKWMVS